MVARASPAMWSVWSASEPGTTDNTRTALVRWPYNRSGKMKGYESRCSEVIWRPPQSASRGGGLHAGGARNDVELLQQWLADPGVRLITLIGPGGVGKTRLALELAREIAAEGTTRVAFTPLAAIRDPGLAACAIAEALGLADLTAVDLPRRARTACDGHPTLLVLDSFEQVLDAAPLVADLLISATTVATAGHQPRAAPRPGRAGVRARASRIGGGLRGDVACRSGARPRRTTFRRTGTRRPT